jgi:hypothetical protein
VEDEEVDERRATPGNGLLDGRGEQEPRQARARRLRAEIARLKEGGKPEDAPREPESPREFIERRMRELEAAEKQDHEHHRDQG